MRVVFIGDDGAIPETEPTETAAAPNVGDLVVWNGIHYQVCTRTWDYDWEVLNVLVRQIGKLS